MKLTTFAAFAAISISSAVTTQAATVFTDNFDGAGDGIGAGSFTNAWAIEGSLFGGAGTESIAEQPSGNTAPNWAFFQTNNAEGSGINIDTGAATIASQEYEFSFLTGSRSDELYTGTMTAQLWDWDGTGALTTEGTLIGSFVGANNIVSTITANSQNFTSAASIEGNVYVRFDLTANAGADFAQPLLDNVSVTAVPEPSSAALLGLGGLALILRRRK